MLTRDALALRTIDFCATTVGHQALTREIFPGNNGTADLIVQSIEIIGDRQLSLTVSTIGNDLVPMPFTIPTGLGVLTFKITVRLDSVSPAAIFSTLRVVSNDADSPIVDYPLRAMVLADIEGTVEEAFLNLFLPPAPSTLSKANGPTAPAPDNVQTVTLRLDTNAAHTVTSEIP